MTDPSRKAEVDTVRWSRIYLAVALNAVVMICALWAFSEIFR